jgi:hypothetical protein
MTDFGYYEKRQGCSCNRPWRPTGLCDIKTTTFSRQSAHRWWWGCWSDTLVILHPQEESWYSLSYRLSQPKDHSGVRSIRSIGKSSDLTRNQIHDLPVCCIHMLTCLFGYYVYNQNRIFCDEWRKLHFICTVHTCVYTHKCKSVHMLIWCNFNML